MSKSGWLLLCFLGACAGSDPAVVPATVPATVPAGGGLEQDLAAFDFSEEGAWSLQQSNSAHGDEPSQ